MITPVEAIPVQSDGAGDGSANEGPQVQGPGRGNNNVTMMPILSELAGPDRDGPGVEASKGGVISWLMKAFHRFRAE
ncbi:MAG: hypothetical protein K1X79_00850 [Oligoflexia bacterium]|nr:hypothetical protein [Oligoflexia bacterium]